MPVPLVLAAAAASGAAAVGANAAGGNNWFVWWFFSKRNSPDLTEEHQRSLDAQHQITLARIDEANAALVGLQGAIRAVDISEAAENVVASAASIHQSTDQLSHMAGAFREAGQEARLSADAIAALNPGLQALLEKMQEENVITAARLDALNVLLTTKDQDMAQARRDIQTLTQVVGEQAETIALLGDTVQEQQQTIVTQAQKITDLSAESARTYKNCQFFKQMALEARAPLPAVSNSISA